jgi:hypothetical protein
MGSMATTRKNPRPGIRVRVSAYAYTKARPTVPTIATSETDRLLVIETAMAGVRK